MQVMPVHAYIYRVIRDMTRDIVKSIAVMPHSCTIRLRNAVSPRNSQVPHKSSASIEVFHMTSQSHYVTLVAILEYSSRYSEEVGQG